MDFKTLFSAVLLMFTNAAHSAPFTEIEGLDIGGTLYDVTFHTQPGDTFNALWDQDNDGFLGGGTSLFSTAPTFWGDIGGASLAAQAIGDFLGDTHTISGGSDSFYVPYGAQADVATSDRLSADIDFIEAIYDALETPIEDANIFGGQLENLVNLVRPYASFQTTSAQVSTPYTAALLALGLLMVAAIRRHSA